MRKLIIAFMVLLLPMSAYGKILVLSSNGAANSNAIWISGEWETYATELGVEWDVMLASDTTAVQTAFVSGDYTAVHCLNMPTVDASFDSHVEIEAAGWGNLDEWVNRNHSNRCEIPMVLYLPSDLPFTGCWNAEVTGVGSESAARSGADEVVMTTPDGDSLYVTTHWDGSYDLRVRSDSSWVDAIVYHDTTADSTGMEYAYIWRTVGTGTHKVYYVKLSPVSWVTAYYPAMIALTESVRPIQVALIVDRFGEATTTGCGADTVGLDYGLNEICLPYMVAEGMKVDFAANLYYIDGTPYDQINTAITYIRNNSNNLRLIYSNVDDDAGNDWLNSGSTAANITTSADGCSTLAAGNTYIAGDIEPIVYAYNGWYGAYVDVEDVMEGLGDSFLTGIYTYGFVSGRMPPYYAHCEYIGSGIINEGETNQLYANASYLGARASDSEANADTIKMGYADRWDDDRGVFIAQWLKHLAGWYHTHITAAHELDSHGSFTHGTTLYTAGAGGGGKDTYGVGADSTQSALYCTLYDINAQVEMLNHIVSRFGNGASSAVIEYAWLSDINYDRKHGRQWNNSHVTRE